MSTLHTTLAQDSFRLYFGVIDYVTDALKKDLKKKGKDEDEATEIVNKLQLKWKENLHKSHCIDNKNMMGLISDNGKEKSPSNNDYNQSNPANNANTFSPNIPPPTSFTTLPPEMPLPDIDEEFDQNHNNHNHNRNYHEPRRKKQKLNNPHIRGMGVPQIEQVHNPFTNPMPTNIHQNDGGNDVMDNSLPQKVYEGNVRFIVQSDGPSPMKPTHVGFDDDDDDDDDEEEETKTNDKKQSDKQEMDDNEAENKNDTNSSMNTPHLVNGRDLNAPLCSDDDDTDDGEDLDPPDKIICQFTKVSKKRNDWSVDLKHGLMHINGKDYAFQTATGGAFKWE